MIRKQFLLATIAFCLFIPTNAKIKITPTENKSIKNGKSIFYALPKNELCITIKTVHTWYKKGPFYRYAGRFLAEDNIITEDSDSWSIESIEVENKTIADSTQIFQITPSKKSIVNLITLNKDGIICGINTPKAKNKNIENSAVITSFCMPDFEFDKSVLGEEALIANSTAKMAELAAKQIYHIRENRNLLLTGDLEFPADSESLKVLLKEMEQMEQKLLELFVGKEFKKNHTKVIYFSPEAETDEVLIRFSETIGLVAKDDLSGDPIYIKISTDKKNLNLNPKKKEKSGIHYRYPAIANITIYNATDINICCRYPIAQLGDILILPNTLLKKGNQIEFDENNGHLIQIKTKKED